MTMKLDEIKTLVERMDVASARGRAEINGRAISLDPLPHEVEMATRQRADGYMEMARRLGDLVRSSRFGVTKDELEKVEFIREQFVDLAKNANMDLITRG